MKAQLLQALGVKMGQGWQFNTALSVEAAEALIVTGPWFTHHLRRPSANFDFEVCVPVNAVVQAVGRVAAGQLPATARAA